MRISIKHLITAALLGLVALSLGAQAATKVRIALGDVASVETLSMLVALERAKEKGLDYELTAFARKTSRYRPSSVAKWI
jgi:NitT/TauT family transport system substrate-binding protein